jgi:hypothetical protein
MKKTALVLTLLLMVGTVLFSFTPGYSASSLSVSLPGNHGPISWPPQLDKSYPDLLLINHKGDMTRLSDFKGNLLLIEPIGMNCPACNGFAGAKTKGGFNGLKPQQGLESIEEYFNRYNTGISFDDPRIIHIHLLLYNFTMGPPTRKDAQAWAEHFGISDRPTYYVLAGGKELQNRASYNMIPGFQLVDKHFILRSDSSGHYPHDGLDHLLRMIPELIDE